MGDLEKGIIPAKRVEGAAQSFGDCIFCGQSFMLNTIGEGGDPEILNKHATRMCKCDEAREWRMRENSVNKATQNIDEMFGDSVTSSILKENLERVMKGDIAKITVDSGEGYKGELMIGSKFKIKVSKSISKKITREVG